MNRAKELIEMLDEGKVYKIINVYPNSVELEAPQGNTMSASIKDAEKSFKVGQKVTKQDGQWVKA